MIFSIEAGKSESSTSGATLFSRHALHFSNAIHNDLAGGKRSWLALKKKLQGYLVILDEWQKKKCRQYGWSQKVLDGLSSMRCAAKQAAELLACVEEEGKKRVVVQKPAKAMHKSCPEYASMLIASISSPNHDWSFEFT